MNGFEVREFVVEDLLRNAADYNPRRIDDEAREGLRASTSSFGLVQPVVWNRRTGNVVGGHQRLSTLPGDSTTDVVVVDLDEGREKALNVALNSPSIQGRWDDDLVHDLLKQVEVEIPDLAADLRIDDLATRLSDQHVYSAEVVRLDDLKPHPRNYRGHPEDQVKAIADSIRQHGFYRNVAVARDGTILAGHGVTLAARLLGLTRIPVRRLRLDPDDPRALKLIAGDNELSRLAEVDDRALSELLREVMGEDPEGLAGTGFDEAMLANLLMVTRPASEIRDVNEAAEWVGMPEYEQPEERLRVVVSFRSREDVDEFARRLGIEGEVKKSIWFPPKEREDPSSYRFDDEELEELFEEDEDDG